EYIYVASGGYYTVSSITDGTHVVLTNTGYTGNATAGATINSVSAVSPGGIQGAVGPTGATGPTGPESSAVVMFGAGANIGASTCLGVDWGGGGTCLSSGFTADTTGVAWGPAPASGTTITEMQVVAGTT